MMHAEGPRKLNYWSAVESLFRCSAARILRWSPCYVGFTVQVEQPIPPCGGSNPAASASESGLCASISECRSKLASTRTTYHRRSRRQARPCRMHCFSGGQPPDPIAKQVRLSVFISCVLPVTRSRFPSVARLLGSSAIRRMTPKRRGVRALIGLLCVDFTTADLEAAGWAAVHVDPSALLKPSRRYRGRDRDYRRDSRGSKNPDASTLISIHARCQLLANALTVKGEAVEGSGK
jgi:hypothetical protein